MNKEEAQQWYKNKEFRLIEGQDSNGNLNLGPPIDTILVGKDMDKFYEVKDGKVIAIHGPDHVVIIDTTISNTVKGVNDECK